jgi:uncharacterized protein YqjF (DUF2071 family)
MRLSVRGNEVEYSSRRRFPGPTPADFECRYSIGESIGSAEPGTFEHFLAERYILYARSSKALRIGRVHHKPYPLHRASVHEVRESMVRATGLPQPSGDPHALYSPGVDVDVFALKPVA